MSVADRIAAKVASLRPKYEDVALPDWCEVVRPVTGEGFNAATTEQVVEGEPVQFVVADADGTPPRWVPVAEARRFWMHEVRPRIVPADARHFDYDSYPGRYCYAASLWSREGQDPSPLVLLERYH